MYYGVIIEPGKNHSYIDVEGEFISDIIFISQAKLNCGDIIVINKHDWFKIESVDSKNESSFKYKGNIIDANNLYYSEIT